MNSIIKAVVLLFIASSVAAEPQKQSLRELPIEEIVGMYADSSGEKVIIDPRVKGKIRIFGQSSGELSYANLSTILAVLNFTTYRSDDYLVVVPKNIIKQQAIELVEQGQQYAPDESVSDLIMLDKLCPADVVAVLRPLLPPTSHFAFMPASRSMLITGTYSNTQRIRTIVERLNSQLEKTQSCSKSK